MPQIHAENMRLPESSTLKPMYTFWLPWIGSVHPLSTSSTWEHILPLKFHLLWSLVFQLPLYLITCGFSVSSEALSLLVPFRVGTVLLNLGYTVAQTLPDEGRGREWMNEWPASRTRQVVVQTQTRPTPNYGLVHPPQDDTSPIWKSSLIKKSSLEKWTCSGGVECLVTMSL